MRINIYIVSCQDEIENSLFEKLLSGLSNTERKSVLVKARKKDRDLVLISYLLLYHVLKVKFKLNTDAYILIRNEFGKPSLAGRPDIQINISRTEGLAALAVSEEPVGIDVEYEKRIDIDFIHRYFHKLECDYIMKNSSDRLNRFYKIWTMKESYLKALGVGLNKDLNSFSVVDERGEIRLGEYDTKTKDSWSMHYWKNGDYNHCSVCAKYESFEYRLTEYNYFDFIKN